MLRSITHRHFYYTGLHALIWLLLFSKAGISIAIVYLLLLSIFRIPSVSPLKITLNKAAFSLSTYKKAPLAYYSLCVFFLLTVFSGINSTDVQGWIHFLKLKAPYLLLPLVFINHTSLNRKVYLQLYLSLIAVLSLSSVFVLANYILDWQAITKSISTGKALTTPLSHVKFSVLCAIASISSFILAGSKFLNKKLLLAFSGFLALVVHVLAVRTGLVVLYGVGGVLLIYHLWKFRKYNLIALVIITGIMTPILAYYTIPSVKHKVHYMLYDFKMIQEGHTANYSDGERIRSLQIGMNIIKKHPVFGVGVGDIRTICESYYDDWFPDSQKRILPHNQYLLVWAAYGLIALIVFLFCLLYPILFHPGRSDLLLVSLIFTLILYGMVEKPLDEYVFITVHSLLACCGISLAQIDN